jgi:hypothetical protein
MGRGLVTLFISILAGGLAWAAAPAGGSPALAAPAAVDDVVRGVTLDPWGRVLDGVDVVLAPATEKSSLDEEDVSRVKSDGTGRFRFGDVTPGLYRLIAMKGGYTVLVAEIDTLVRSTVDLVLYPAGPKREAGKVPRDASWALRLPERDRLEERGGPSVADETAAPPPSEGSGHVFREPLYVSVGRAHADSDRGASAQGFDVHIEGALTDGALGRLDLDFAQHSVSARGARSEERQSLGLRWTAPALGSAAETGIDLNAQRARRERDPGGTETAGDALRFEMSHRVWDARGETTFVLEGAAHRARQRLGAGSTDRELGAERLHASVERRVVDGGRREVRTRVDAHGAWGVPLDAATIPMAPAALFDEDSLFALEHMRHPQVDAHVDARFLLSGNVALTTGGTVGRRFGDGRGWHGNARSAVRVSLDGSTALGAEAALVRWTGGETEAAWRMELERQGPSWSLLLARAREVGPAAHSWREAEAASAGPSWLVATERGGLVDLWTAEARWAGDSGWPDIALAGTRYEVLGTLVARLPGDAPITPLVTEGHAEGLRIDLEVASPEIGTFVALVWESLAGEDVETSPLSGAEGWTRRSINLRQRLGLGEGWASRCFLLLSVGDRRLEGPPLETDTARPDAARLALLEERRFSGGLAVAF